LPFAHQLGFDYLLRMDSDSYILGPFCIDLVQQLRGKGASIARRNARHLALQIRFENAGHCQSLLVTTLLLNRPNLISC